MPRLPHSLLRHAFNISPFLPLLLRTCRSLSSARNELRWLRERAHAFSRGKTHHKGARDFLLRLCLRRGRGVPLQYLLGTQPFGDLDIICRPGVLIPRPETDAYTSHLAALLRQDPQLGQRDDLKILDLCSGTGCISLLLHALLSEKLPNLRVMGLDVSELALKLARDNLQYNVMKGRLARGALRRVSFVKADILLDNFFHLEQHLGKSPASWDVVISNPPYISEAGFNKDTSRSVRNWEPKLALVPPPSVSHLKTSAVHAEDVFYPPILDMARISDARVLLMEVGDMAQALSVAGLALQTGIWRSVEIWRDWPDQEDADRSSEDEETVIGSHRIPIRGSGRGRSVFCRR